LIQLPPLPPVINLTNWLSQKLKAFFPIKPAMTSNPIPHGLKQTKIKNGSDAPDQHGGSHYLKKRMEGQKLFRELEIDATTKICFSIDQF
jgi:hypothetical protein